jgi:hypothetical protein
MRARRPSLTRILYDPAAAAAEAANVCANNKAITIAVSILDEAPRIGKQVDPVDVALVTERLHHDQLSTKRTERNYAATKLGHSA